MFKCLDCKTVFEECGVRHTTYENYYGVSSDFPSSTALVLSVCPNCGSEDIEALKQCEWCSEWFEELEEGLCEECLEELLQETEEK